MCLLLPVFSASTLPIFFLPSVMLLPHPTPQFFAKHHPHREAPQSHQFWVPCYIWCRNVFFFLFFIDLTSSGKYVVTKMIINVHLPCYTINSKRARTMFALATTRPPVANTKEAFKYYEMKHKRKRNSTELKWEHKNKFHNVTTEYFFPQFCNQWSEWLAKSHSKWFKILCCTCSLCSILAKHNSSKFQ